MNLETTNEAGVDTIPLPPPAPGRRFIASLHVPNQASWWGQLAAYAYLSSHNTPQQIIAQEVIDDLLGKDKGSHA